MGGCSLCNFVHPQDQVIRAHSEEKHDGQARFIRNITAQQWSRTGAAWRVENLSIAYIIGETTGKVVSDDVASAVADLSDIENLQFPEDLLLVAPLRIELPFERFGTFGGLILASTALKRHTHSWFRSLNIKASDEGTLQAELDNHLSAAAELFASIYTAAWVTWRHKEFADHVPVESRSDRSRRIQPTFDLITPTIAQACEALDVLLWRETIPNAQMS
ncbi:hypothetical protein CF326_g4848 [Tilletia indica]|nr:hypothetical protein CF326_g4848 [Tilletia indica]